MEARLYISKSRTNPLHMQPAIRLLLELMEAYPDLDATVVDIDVDIEKADSARIVALPTLQVACGDRQWEFVGDIEESRPKIVQIVELYCAAGVDRHTTG